MAHSADHLDILRNYVSALEFDPSLRENTFIDRLIGGEISKISVMIDDDDEFDIYRELHALPRGLRRKMAAR